MNKTESAFTYFVEVNLITIRSARTLLIIFSIVGMNAAYAHQNDSSLFQQIKTRDSLLFDVGYNTCNIPEIEKITSDDFEFYHDEAGEMNSKIAFINSIANGLCKLSYRPIRKLEPGTMEVFPMYRHDTLYAAVQNGFHRFYAIEAGKPERFTSRARFSILWKLEKGEWKLSRCLSYDHQQYSMDEAPDFDDSSSVIGWLKEAKVPALGIGIIKDGSLREVKMYGDLDSGRAANRNSIFNVASITKTMTAMLVLRLVSAGKWDLDEPLYHYWTDPDVEYDPRSKLITTRHILNQQSGFPNWRREFKDARLAFLARPGTQYRYSGEGFEYLRHALENKFHQPLDRLADSLIFRPLKMRNTHYVWSSKMDTSNFAIPHDAQQRALALDRNTTPNAADLVKTTIPDLAKFLIAVLNKEGVSEKVYNEMVRPAVETKANRYIGLCWFIYKPVGQNEYAIAHGGDDAGMHSICFLLPQSKEGLIIFTNSDNGPKLYAAVLKRFLGEKGKEIVEIEMK